MVLDFAPFWVQKYKNYSKQQRKFSKICVLGPSTRDFDIKKALPTDADRALP